MNTQQKRKRKEKEKTKAKKRKPTIFAPTTLPPKHYGGKSDTLPMLHWIFQKFFSQMPVIAYIAKVIATSPNQEKE